MNATYSTVGSTLFSICGRYSTEWLSWRGAKFTIGGAGRWASQQDCMYCINWKRMYANQIISGMSSITTKTMITSSGASNLFNMFLLTGMTQWLWLEIIIWSTTTRSRRCVSFWQVKGNTYTWCIIVFSYFYFFNCTKKTAIWKTLTPPPPAPLNLNHTNYG
jgi:hypothetical protein